VDKDFKDKLRELRQRVPIGIQRGLLFLEQTKGSIHQAESLFKRETILEVMNEAEVSEDIALTHLKKFNYDVYFAINSINEERYTYTERVLKKFRKDKFTALNLIVGKVEIKEGLERSSDCFWLNLEHLTKLEKEVFCLVLMIEWLNYEDYEGLEYAVHFHLDTVINQINNQLLLPQVSITLQNAREINKIHFEGQKVKFGKEDVLSKLSEFDEQKKIFANQKPLLINRLYEFATIHMSKFPL
jgi:hypothetical protein